jgi:ATP-dependent helicase/nuclease subunit B
MRLVFDPALDGPGWPGVLGDREVAHGEAWVGPLGLRTILETQLGLGGAFASSLERACRLGRALQASDGFWRRSFDCDPIGTSRRLLRDRDTLAMWGWKGEPVSERLAELHRVTRDAEPGMPDRLSRIAIALGLRKVGVQSIALFLPMASLEPLWRTVLAALAGQGVVITESEIPKVAARGDLGRAARGNFTPDGDGTISLLRRYGSLDTADEVAATLAALDDLAGVVVVGGDGVLDRALARQGLPRLGADADVTASSRILPLVVEAAFEPMDPGDLHALLALEPGPVPRGLATSLLRGLGEQPGRRSPSWAEALARGLADRGEDGDRLEERITALVMPSARQHEKLGVAALRTRLDVLRGWANARARSVGSLVVIGQQVAALMAALDLLGSAEVSRAELRRLCSELELVEWPSHLGESGLAHVGDPGALLGPARIVVWWNFTRARAPRPGRLFLTGAEEKALVAAGIEAPDFALLMEAEARRWRRPLALATDALVLACPQTNESGEPNQPHPLWDELTASLARADDIHKLETSGLDRLRPARRIAAALRPLVKPAAAVTAPAPLALREVESPSSLERLIGCSYSWALRYPGRLRAGLSDGPGLLDNRRLGSLGHDLLAQVFAARPTTPEAAAQLANDTFDAQAARRCEALDLPAHQVQRATLRRVVADTARALTRVLGSSNANVVGTELSQQLAVLGVVMEGRLDLVLETPDFVIDLKWGKARYVEALETGTAVQLAAYAAMRQAACGRGEVDVGYYLMRTQELVTGPRARLADGYAPGPHTAPTIWAATVSAARTRQGELAAASLQAPGSDGSDARSVLDAAGLRLAPSCGYCDYGGLCGRAGAR